MLKTTSAAGFLEFSQERPKIFGSAAPAQAPGLSDLLKTEPHELAEQWNLKRELRSEVCATLKAARALADPAAQLCAVMRGVVFGLSRAQYGELVELSPEVVRNLEMPAPGSLARARKVAHANALLNCWESQAAGADPARSTLFAAAREKLLDELEGESRGSSVGLVMRWRYQAGLDVADAAGLDGAVLAQHRDRHVCLDFPELLRLARAMRIVPEKLSGPDLWEHPEIARARAALLHDAQTLGRPAGLTLLSAALGCAGYVPTRKLYRETFAVSPKDAIELARFNTVELKGIAPILNRLERDAALSAAMRATIESSWEAPKINGRIPFLKSVEALMDRDGISKLRLAQILSPLTGAALTPFKIGAVLSGEINLTSIPHGVLAYATAANEKELGVLLRERREEIEAQMLRKKAGTYVAGRAQRALWAVGYRELGLDTTLVKHVEWERDTSTEAREKLSDAISAAAEKKALAAIREWHEVHTNPLRLIPILSEEIGKINLKEALGKSVHGAALRRVYAGEELPHLPQYMALLERCGLNATAERRAAWGDAYAEKLRAQGATPLAAALLTIAGSQFSSDGQTRGERDLAAPLAWHEPARRLRAGESVEASELQHLLPLLKVGKGTLSATWLEALGKHGSGANALREVVNQSEQVPEPIRERIARLRSWHLVEHADDRELNRLFALKCIVRAADKREAAPDFLMPGLLPEADAARLLLTFPGLTRRELLSFVKIS